MHTAVASSIALMVMVVPPPVGVLPAPPLDPGKYKYPEFDPLVTTMGAAPAPTATSAAAARAHS